MRTILLAISLSLFAALHPGTAHAQLLDRKQISLEAARTMAAAGEAEARRNGWNVAISVVDLHGELIYFLKLDGTQQASVDIAQQKARTAARFKRPTQALAEAVAGGSTGLLGVEGLLPLTGGVPVVVDGEVIGAVGVSGVTSQQDAVVATAAVAALPR